MKIISTVKVFDDCFFNAHRSNEELQDEPMFYRASLEYAEEHGGEITKEFLRNLPQEWRSEKHLTIDSRVHMLMPGWFPCIPGFHHDDIPRTRADGQPNYDKTDYQADHLMGLVNGDVAPTEFALGEIDLEVPVEGSIIYKEWHKEVESAVKSGMLESFSAPSGKYIQFDNMSFHQGTAAVRNGWRWFIRVSRNTERAHSCKNVIRKQVQVYMNNPMQGW